MARALALLLLCALLGPGTAARAEPEPAALARVERVDAFPELPSPTERLQEIRRRIERALVYPRAARRQGLTGVSELAFEIGADGRATSIVLLRSSGHPILDRAAQQGVERAGILPRVYGRLRVPVRFALDGR